jgi:hypothetical protein
MFSNETITTVKTLPIIWMQGLSASPALLWCVCPIDCTAHHAIIQQCPPATCCGKLMNVMLKMWYTCLIDRFDTPTLLCGVLSKHDKITGRCYKKWIVGFDIHVIFSKNLSIWCPVDQGSRLWRIWEDVAQFGQGSSLGGRTKYTCFACIWSEPRTILDIVNTLICEDKEW